MPVVSILVNGRVQGVGFRYFVLKLANEKGIGGEVWNRRDGGVEILASHTDSDLLAEFEAMLKTGPGRVTHVTSFPALETTHLEFRISDTR